MRKHLLSLTVFFGLAATAQAQTAPATTTGNHTAGTTSNPVDPTSTTGQAVSGATGQGSRNAAPDRSTTSGRAPAATTGNHTAGTTTNPVDPTSNMSSTTRATDRPARKTTKTKVRTTN